MAASVGPCVRHVLAKASTFQTHTLAFFCGRRGRAGTPPDCSASNAHTGTLVASMPTHPYPTPLPSRRPLAFFFRRARFCKHPSRQHLDTPSRQHLDTHSLQTQLTTESLHALRSLKYNNLDADAKRALTEANKQRRTPLELEL